MQGFPPRSSERVDDLDDASKIRVHLVDADGSSPVPLMIPRVINRVAPLVDALKRRRGSTLT